jgi:hypothetical protein
VKHPPQDNFVAAKIYRAACELPGRRVVLRDDQPLMTLDEVRLAR